MLIKAVAPYLCFILACIGAKNATGAVVVPGDPADCVIRPNNTTSNQDVDRLGGVNTGFTNTKGSRVAVYVFRLPAPGPGQQPIVNSAIFQFTVINDLDNGDFNIDLYGLTARALSTVVPATDNYVGSLDASPTATLLQDNILLGVHPSNNVGTITPNGSGTAALVSYLNAQYGVGGVGIGNYIFLRLNPDSPASTTVAQGYDIGFAENTTVPPQLTIGFVPEPSISTLMLAAALWHLGRRSRSKFTRPGFRSKDGD